MAEEASSTKIVTLENILVFVFCEVVGGPFCYAAAQEILDGKYTSGFVGFAIGVPFAITGVGWFWFKPWLQQMAAAVNQSISANLLGGALLVAFVYVAGPSFLKRMNVALAHSQPADLIGTPTPAATPEPPEVTNAILAAKGLRFTPEFAQNLSRDLLSLPRPCTLKLIAPKPLIPVRDQLVSAAANSTVPSVESGEADKIARCDVIDEQEDQHPELYGRRDFPSVGMVIHTSEKNIGARKYLAALFGSQSTPIAGDSILPPGSPDNLIYIEIGQRLHE
jgi:hypothetical protein